MRPPLLRTGVDPAKWCAWDYAVISVDARGAGASEGNVAIMGTQEGEDGYDVIEAVAKMDWCNGNVALAGNSHLAIVQWFIAAQNPPSLKAIAPWEGCSDLYVSRNEVVGGYGSSHTTDDDISLRSENNSFEEESSTCPTLN